MISNLFQFLHIAPLAVIVLALGAFIILRTRENVVRTESLLGLLVACCAIGILAGSALHHDEIVHMFDPCIGYSFTLAGIAVAMFRRKHTAKNVV